MRAPAYFEVKTKESGDEVIHYLRYSRFILGTFILMFSICMGVGIGFALSGTDNPGYLIVAIVSLIIVFLCLGYLGPNTILRIEYSQGVLEITKTYFTWRYKQEQISLREIEKVLYEEGPFVEGSPKAYLWVVDQQGKHILFTGDSWLKSTGEDLAQELHCEFAIEKDVPLLMKMFSKWGKK